MKKKIAVLVNSFWISGSGTSGGDQRAMQIFSRISACLDMDIYTSADGVKVYKKVIKNAHFIKSPGHLEKGNIFVRYLKRAKWLSKKLLEQKYDYIYSTSDFFPDVIPAFKYKKKFPQAKWIACIFHIYPDWRKRPGNKLTNLVGTMSQRFSFKKISGRADRVVNINTQVRSELLRKYHFDKRQIQINPCGIDLSYFSKIHAQKNPFTCTFLARLHPSKGIFDLPEIWQKVISKIPKAKLQIIGGGSDEIKSELKDKCNQLGLEGKYQIMGFVPDDKAYKIVKESEIFIFPSHEEGFGIAIAEAFACGVPVVAWALPVYSEVFPRGLVKAKRWSANAFAAEVIKLLSNKKRLAAVAAESLEMVQKYNWKQIALDEKAIILN